MNNLVLSVLILEHASKHLIPFVMRDRCTSDRYSHKYLVHFGNGPAEFRIAGYADYSAAVGDVLSRRSATMLMPLARYFGHGGDDYHARFHAHFRLRRTRHSSRLHASGRGERSLATWVVIEAAGKRRGRPPNWWPRLESASLCRQGAAHNPTTGPQSASLICVN